MSLQCNETLVNDKVLRASSDHVLLHDKRNFENLQRLECPVPGSYFNRQSDIKEYMRPIVASWMKDVAYEQNTEKEVFPLAVNILDRFLYEVEIKRNCFQPFAAACILVASKVKDSEIVKLEKLVEYTDYSCTKEDIINCEKIILSKLAWKINVTTPMDFLNPLLHAVGYNFENNCDGDVYSKAIAYVELCSIGDKDSTGKLMNLSPSLVAAACIGSAFYVWKQEQISQCESVNFENICNVLSEVTKHPANSVLDCMRIVIPLAMANSVSVYVTESSTDNQAPAAPKNAAAHHDHPENMVDQRQQIIKSDTANPAAAAPSQPNGEYMKLVDVDYKHQMLEQQHPLNESTNNI